MRILLIHFCRFPPRTGGEYVYFKIYEALRQRFHVTNVTTNFANPFLQRFQGKRKTVMRRIMEPMAVLYPLWKKKTYDLIFTSWSSGVPFFGDLVYAQPPTGALAKLTKGYKFSVKPHRRLLDTTISAIGTGILFPWTRFFGWFSLKYHTFISCSNAVKSFIKHQHNKDSTVIYPPVPTHLYNVKGAHKKDIVLSIGRVDPEKRFDLIGTVGTQIPRAKFILMGGADATGKKIVEQIEGRFKKAGLGDNFAYLGRVSESVKRELLLEAKVLFHPAPYESFSITIVEGMAAGAIPIAHNSGGTPEAVPPHRLFTNVDEAVEKVRSALSEASPAVAKSMKAVTSKFGEERFKREILDVVDSTYAIKLQRK